MAYKIPADKKVEVLKHLDFREKNGYERHKVDFYPYHDDVKATTTCLPISIYVATQDNDSFAGPTEMHILAKQIHGAIGPSGPNTEYVYKLAEAMRSLFPNEIDDHLFELEHFLRNMEITQII